MKLNPVEFRAYKLRLEKSDRSSCDKVVEEILSFGDFPDELVPTLIDAIEEGKYIFSQRICSVIEYTQSTELLELAVSKERLLGIREQARLLKMGFYLPEIEKRLLDTLYEGYQKDSDPFRCDIVEAMAVRGTRDSLELLEVIDYELTPAVKQRKAQALQSPPSLEGRMSIEMAMKSLELQQAISFLEKVRNGIESISARIRDIEQTSDTELKVLNSAIMPSKELQYIKEIQKKANYCLKTNPEESLNCARKVAEGLCLELARMNNITFGRNEKLDTYINKLKREGHIPDHIAVYMQTIRGFGNIGSHYQKPESKDHLSKAAMSCVDSMNFVMEWFESNL